MPRSRSAVSTRRTSGAARACRRSSSPTPTAPGSPTVRRRLRRRCSKAPRITRDRPWRPARRARTRRRRSCCRGRATRCRARVSIKSKVPSGLTGRTRRCPTSPRRRRTPTACPRHRGSRSPGDPGSRIPDVPGTPVPIAPGPPGARTEPLGPLPGPAPPIPSTHPRQQLPPGPAAPPGPGGQLPAPFIATQVEPEAAA